MERRVQQIIGRSQIVHVQIFDTILQRKILGVRIAIAHKIIKQDGPEENLYGNISRTHIFTNQLGNALVRAFILVVFAIPFGNKPRNLGEVALAKAETRIFPAIDNVKTLGHKDRITIFEMQQRRQRCRDFENRPRHQHGHMLVGRSILVILVMRRQDRLEDVRPAPVGARQFFALDNRRKFSLDSGNRDPFNRAIRGKSQLRGVIIQMRPKIRNAKQRLRAGAAKITIGLFQATMTKAHQRTLSRTVTAPIVS